METVHDTDVVFEAVAESGLRATIGKCMMDSTRRCRRGCRRRRGASIDESVAHPASAGTARANGRLQAAFAPRFAVSCSRELLEAVAGLSAAASTRSCTRTRRSRATRSRSCSRSPAALTNIEYLAEPAAGVAASVRRALRLGRRRRAGAARRARRQGDALPRLEPEARIRASRRCPRCGRAASRCRSAPTARPATTGSTCSRRCGWRRCCRRCARQPGVAGGARRRCGWRPATARGRSGSSTRSDRSRSASAPTSSSSIATGRTWRRGPIPYSTLVYAARGSDVRTTIVDGEVLVDDVRPGRVVDRGRGRARTPRAAARRACAWRANAGIMS